MTVLSDAASIAIGPVVCPPGERASGLIEVAVGVHGAPIGIPLLVVNGVQPGPRLALAAGVHGDEYEPMAAVRRVLVETDPATLRGTLIGLPCVNTPAFDAAARTSGIDRGNLNRLFPGDASGPISERIAATFVDVVIPAIDALVDLHTGGALGEIMPLTIVQSGFEELAHDLGRAIGHQVIWKGGRWSGTARIATLEAGKPAVTVEVGGGVYREDIVAMHAEAARKAMRHLGMLDGEAPAPKTWVEVAGNFERAAAGGFLELRTQPGDRKRAGEPLATIVDHLGDIRDRVLAPADGIVLWTRRVHTVQPGDELVIFGEVLAEHPHDPARKD
jgi:uncharacterized protein